MFNDILTGKATNEPPPPPVSPYREQGVLPPVTHVCASCTKPYKAPAQSAAGLCPSCHVAKFEAETRFSAAVLTEAQESARRADLSHKRLRAALIIVGCIAFGLFKFAMKNQMREDAAQAAGYSSYSEYKDERDSVYPTDEFSQRVNELADEMCRCDDLRCAREVSATYVRFMRSGAASDDKARASVQQDSARLADCQARHESQ